MFRAYGSVPDNEQTGTPILFHNQIDNIPIWNELHINNQIKTETSSPITKFYNTKQQPPVLKQFDDNNQTEMITNNHLFRKENLKGNTQLINK